jgi:hypothetical protein
MALGIRQTLALAGSLVFALPLGIFALEQLLAGEQLVGALLLVVAALMVWLPQYLTTPGDIPGKVADKAVGRALPDEETDTDE